MELKDYTTEELKAEIKRRVELAKAQKKTMKEIAIQIPEGKKAEWANGVLALVDGINCNHIYLKI